MSVSCSLVPVSGLGCGRVGLVFDVWAFDQRHLVREPFPLIGLTGPGVVVRSAGLPAWVRMVTVTGEVTRREVFCAFADRGARQPAGRAVLDQRADPALWAAADAADGGVR